MRKAVATEKAGRFKCGGDRTGKNNRKESCFGGTEAFRLVQIAHCYGSCSSPEAD